MRDAKRKGKLIRKSPSPLCGANAPMAKLSERDAIAIFRHSSDTTNTDIGAKFGVSRHTVAKIRNGSTWKYITNIKEAHE